MTPYATFLYFGVLLYVVAPTVALGLAGRASRTWLLIASTAMLAVQYARPLDIAPGVALRELWIVAAFVAYEWAVCLGFLRLRARGHRRRAFHLALLLAALPLVAVKLAPVLAPRFQIGFLGISYVTFRALDVVFCVQDRLITALSPLQFFAFLSFFATTSSGPIDRYRRFATDWGRRRTRAEFLADLDGAVQHVFTGFLYKFVVAALVQRYWLDPAAARAGPAGLLSYMYAYTIHLFFDFAGYTAFAVGVSYLFGIHTPENFDRPFLARNIRDFWNRWHITLSWWLRDHIYMRFVMAAIRGRWFASRHVASTLGFLLAFGLMGLWHGIAPHYLLYGLYHGVLLSAHEGFDRWNKGRRLWGDGPLWRAAGIVATFHCVCLGFLIFSGRLTTAGERPAAAAQGRLETATCDAIGGWAWDPATPARAVTVEVYADGTRVGTAPADLFRPDLAAAGRGDGTHAFVYVPPASLRDGWPHAIDVRVAGSGASLSGGPQSIVCGLTAVSLDGYEGAHEATGCEAITGWARDTTRPERRIEVEIYDGQRRLGAATADRAADRPNAPGDGHAFRFVPPPALADGRPHSISVRIAASNRALAHTPQILTCPPPAPPLAPPPSATPVTAPTATGAQRSMPGAAPAYADNRDGTISALHNGLMWEKKVRLDGIVDAAASHDADNCHPWFGRCTDSESECRVDADCGPGVRCAAEDCQTPAPDGMTIFQWVARLNAQRFAGHDDWRLPTSAELYSIVDPFEAGDPATVAAFRGAACGGSCDDLGDPACSCTDPGLYWAVPRSGPAPDESWMAFFYCNGKLLLDLNHNRFHVRAVRDAR